MKLIRTSYDGYNRQFKLLDTADAGNLRDGETYLFMDFSEEDLKQKELTEYSEDSEAHPTDFAKR